jgi:hypothetical protein
MDWLNELGRRLLILSRRGRFDADLEEEMRLHCELREQEQIERGFSPKQAHYVSLSRFGNDLVLREGESGYVGMELAGTPRARHSVWLANVGQEPRIHSRCDLDARLRHRRLHGGFQRDQCRASETPPIPPR